MRIDRQSGAEKEGSQLNENRASLPRKGPTAGGGGGGGLAVDDEKKESNISFASTSVPRGLFSFGEGQKGSPLVGHVESDYLTRALAHV